MQLFEALAERYTTGGGYESVHFFQDTAAKLRAVVAVHNTALGPSLGGTRALATYASEDQAVNDVLRLARGMTYKAALAGLNHGGGKAVILLPNEPFDREQLFLAFGKAVDTLGGRYITTEDSGTSPADMQVVRKATRFVLGTPPALGGSGDPSPTTAFGTFRGIEAVAKVAFDRSNLRGLKVALLGIGHVGHALGKMLKDAGVELVVADVDADKVAKAKAEWGCASTTVEGIFAEPCDLLSPNALGGILNDQTIPLLRCKAVAGAANNQLAEPRHGRAIQDRGILYAPDYAINAGGLINVASEWVGYDPAAVHERAGKIHETMLEIFARAKAQNRTTAEVADRMAEERFLKRN
jgi:leucine dehydrogenase